MPLTPHIKHGDWDSAIRFSVAVSKKLGYTASPSFVSTTLTALSASRLIWTDANKALASKDLVDLIAGTANEIDVTDDAAGGVTIGIVNPLIVAKGGSGAATFTDGGLLLGSGVGAFTALGQATNGQIPVGSTGLDPVLATITGTANQIISTPGAGTITLSTPQDIHAAATPTFADLTISTPVNIYALSHDSFADFVANEHIDHTAVTLTAGTGLTGGGTIAANRTFAVDGVLEDLDTLGAAASDGQFIVATGAGVFAYESGDTARISLGVGTTDSPMFTGIELGHATDTTITRVSAGVIAVEGVTVMMVGGAPTAHLHDGDTLEHDGVNSSAGAFAFDTVGIVTFSNAITMSAGMDLTIAGHIIFNTSNSSIGFADPRLTFDDTNNLIQVTGKFTLPDSGYLGSVSATTALQILPAGDIVLTNSLYTNAGLYILERAATVGAIATWGHIWVKNTDPNTLWFTDDGGNDIQLGTGIAAHAMLDGSAHTDSVADAVTRGSIIYGNATPKWDELVIGAVDTFLGSDGTDLSYRTAAQVLASLSGEAGAAFSVNSQSITDVGSIVVNDDGTIGVTDGTPSILFDDTDGQVEVTGVLSVPAHAISSGVDGSARGFIYAYGPAGSDYGGSFYSYVSADEDGTIESYMFSAYQDDCYVCYAAGVGAIITVTGPTCGVSISTTLGVTGAITASNYTAANLLTACATNAGGLDFSAASKTLTVDETQTIGNLHTDARAATWLAANHETTYNHSNYNDAYSHVSANGSSHSYIDQSVTSVSTPTFGGIVIAANGTVGQAAGPLMTFDDANNYLEITGCRVGINEATPDAVVQIGPGNVLAGFGTPRLFVAYGMYLGNSSPALTFDSSDAAADNRIWQIFADGTNERFTFRAVNNAGSAAENWLEVERTGVTIDSVTFPNGAVAITDTLGVTGAITAANYTAVNLLTACATSAGGLDFSGAYTLTVGETATTTSYHTDGRAATWLAANHETTYTHTDIALNTTHRGLVAGNPHVVTPTELGLVIGTNTQAFGAVLDDLNTLGAAASNGQFLVATGAGALAWESGATARTSIGLGTTATDVQFQSLILRRASTGLLVCENFTASSAAAGGGIQVGAHDGAALASGDRLGFFLFYGSTGAATQAYGAGIGVHADGAWAGGSAPGKMSFKTTPAGSVTRVTRMTIAANGSVDVVGSLTGGTLHADNGVDFDGAITNLTIVDGVVTAAS